VQTTTLPEKQACKELRSQLSQYHLGVRGAAGLRSQLMQTESLAQIEALFSPYLAEQVWPA
jgi:hypothetical protein